MFTREDDVLDVLAGVVCDANVNFDGLTMIVNLETEHRVGGSEHVSGLFPETDQKLVEKEKRSQKPTMKTRQTFHVRVADKIVIKHKVTRQSYEVSDQLKLQTLDAAPLLSTSVKLQLLPPLCPNWP